MSISQSPRYNSDFFPATHKVNTFVYEAPHDLPFDEMLKPSFWAHVASFMAQWTEIIIHPLGAEYIAELVVVESGHLFAKVALKSKVQLQAHGEDVKALAIEQIGNKFRIRRGPDVMKDGLSTRKDAERWIEDYAGKKAA